MKFFDGRNQSGTPENSVWESRTLVERPSFARSGDRESSVWRPRKLGLETEKTRSGDQENSVSETKNSVSRPSLVAMPWLVIRPRVNVHYIWILMLNIFTVIKNIVLNNFNPIFFFNCFLKHHICFRFPYKYYKYFLTGPIDAPNTPRKSRKK
jgi:hypothetical protein